MFSVRPLPHCQDTFGGLVAFDGDSATNVAVRLGVAELRLRAGDRPL